jgi:hypothetical protein
MIFIAMIIVFWEVKPGTLSIGTGDNGCEVYCLLAAKISYIQQYLTKNQISDNRTQMFNFNTHQWTRS